MSRIPESFYEDRVEDGDAEGVSGKRDPVRSDNPLGITKFRLVLNGEVIYDYGGEGE